MDDLYLFHVQLYGMAFLAADTKGMEPLSRVTGVRTKIYFSDNGLPQMDLRYTYD
jgi:hypothetical protein